MQSLPEEGPQGFYLLLSRLFSDFGWTVDTSGTFGYLGFLDVLQQTRHSGNRILLFLDEFDVAAREPRFTLQFFENLRSAATVYPLTLVVASVAPLTSVAHSEVLGSPFFNIFNLERLTLLSTEESRTIISVSPRGPTGLEDVAPFILQMAGPHPYLLQRACACAWELRETNGSINISHLEKRFNDAVVGQYNYMWNHLSDQEKAGFHAVVQSRLAESSALKSLLERGYLVDTNPPEPCGLGFARYVTHLLQPLIAKTAKIQDRMERVVVVVDLSRYSDIAKELEQHFGVVAVQELNKQIRDLIEGALTEVGIGKEGVPYKGTGDGAIIVLETAAIASQFAEALHRAAANHNLKKDVPLAQRHFRVGIWTNVIIVAQEKDSHDRVLSFEIAGTAIANAVRLEGACKTGEVLICPDTWGDLAKPMRKLYGDQEEVKGKRGERFRAHRRKVVEAAPWETSGL